MADFTASRHFLELIQALQYAHSLPSAPNSLKIVGRFSKYEDF